MVLRHYLSQDDFEFIWVDTNVIPLLLLRAVSSFAPSQWETALLCNDVSHWLGASLESALITMYYCLQTELFWKKNCFLFCIIPDIGMVWVGWNSCTNKTRTWLYYIVNIMPADVLEIFVGRASVSKIPDKVAKVSVVIVLAKLVQNILLLAHTGLPFSSRFRIVTGKIGQYHHYWWLGPSGLIQGLCPANERQRYFVTMSLIGWAQA